MSEIDLGFDEYDPEVDGLQPGTQLGEFTVLKNFGGGEAAVLKVRRNVDGSECALRVPADQSPASRERARINQLKTCAINDGSIPRSFGLVSIPQGPFGMLSEFVRGEDVCLY